LTNTLHGIFYVQEEMRTIKRHDECGSIVVCIVGRVTKAAPVGRLHRRPRRRAIWCTSHAVQALRARRVPGALRPSTARHSLTVMHHQERSWVRMKCKAGPAARWGHHRRRWEGCVESDLL